MRMVIQDGVDHRKAAVVGLAFWLGVGFQSQVIFADLLHGFWGVLFGNGMTAGAIVAILMMLFMDLTGPRTRRLTTGLSSDALPRIDAFLRKFASNSDWNTESTERLVAAGEETLAVLQQEASASESGDRRLIVSARLDSQSVELEFVTALEGHNVEDRLAYLSELPPAPDEHEVSYRLLRHYTSSLRHQKYHSMDVITITVEGVTSEQPH